MAVRGRKNNPRRAGGFANVWQNRGIFAKHWQKARSRGFTLLECLVSLVLAGFLALAVLSAATTYRRAALAEESAAVAERLATEIATLLRLSPDAELPAPPEGWRMETERFTEPAPAEGMPPLGGTRVVLRPPAGTGEDVAFAIYDLPRPEKSASGATGETSETQGENP